MTVLVQEPSGKEEKKNKVNLMSTGSSFSQNYETIMNRTRGISAKLPMSALSGSNVRLHVLIHDFYYDIHKTTKDLLEYIIRYI